MNESEYQDLWVAAGRRDLTVSERVRLEARLSAHPELRDEAVLDERLSRCLRQLPDVPLSTNFTARVLGEVDRSSGRHSVRRVPVWVRWVTRLGHGWRVAAACGALALIVGIPFYQARQRTELARSLEALPTLSLAEVELWRDFDSINNLPTGPVPSIDQLVEAFK